jgi:hypothetical protein
MAVQGRLQGKFFDFDFNVSPTTASAREYCPFQSCKQTLASYLRYRVQVNLNIIVLFHHKIAMKRCLQDDETERQLKCKICDMGLCIFGCFKKYHKKVRFSYMTWGVTPVYIAS